MNLEFLKWSQFWRLETLVREVEISSLYLSNKYKKVKGFRSPFKALHLSRLGTDISRK